MSDERNPSGSGSTGLLDKANVAAVAVGAVTEAVKASSAAVSMRTLEAPDLAKTYISFNEEANQNRTGKVDEVGLPLVYNKELIEGYWTSQGSELTRRWTEFLGYAVPFFSKVVAYLVAGGTDELLKHDKELARDARVSFENLGPTYIKLGQQMSVRPDILPDNALEELSVLQDSVKPFDSVTAINQIESELGGPLGAFFSEISEEPVAAASLAQVYKARLNSTGEYVAVKIQRPSVLEIVSKDLYVLRRAAEVFQGLTDRFAPAQRTDYVGLFNEFAVGFYTELDFLNEAANQMKLKKQLENEEVVGIYIPKVYTDLCTRRVLVSEWIDGKKLSESTPEVIGKMIPLAQEAFLVQLLQTGFFHADPHPGNILLLDEHTAKEKKAKMALIDFGLIASVAQEDMDSMVSSIIHLANKDYASLVDDFINLKVLPPDTDRATVIPLMDKALTPYVKGGGAKKYEEEVRKQYGMDEASGGPSVGSFQAITQDALTVLNDVPFSIPPYFALLGRAIVTLEGIALTGDPDYGIIREAYPFVSRKLLNEDRPVMQKALQQVLYGNTEGGGDDQVGGLQGTRFLVLLNSALGIVAKTDAFIDLDTVPEDAVSIPQTLKFILSEKAQAVRDLLIQEATLAADVLLRQSFRKSFNILSARVDQRNPVSVLARLPGIGQLFPQTSFVDVPVPLLLPSTSHSAESAGSGGLPTGRPRIITLRDFVETATPRLNREEELYAISLVDAIEQAVGKDAANIASGDVDDAPAAAARLLLSFFSPQMKGASNLDLFKTQGFEGLSNGLSSGLGINDSPLSPSLESAIPFVENVLPVLNNVLEVSGVGRGGGITGDVDTHELQTAIADLDHEEAALLEHVVDSVVGGIRGQLIDRLSTIS